MKKWTIFYTDDDEDDLSLFTDAVESLSEDINLQTYSGGEKLLNAVYNPPPTPSIIFLDLNMPGKNGFDVLNELKGSKESSDIPIIIFSTSNEPSIIEKCLSLGANFFITKPVLMKDIIKSIEHSLTINWKEFVPDRKTFVYKL
ncbi:response regulator [Flavobacterium defluvii]|uniref:CheY chemotaxis protein or a CheY-like REC (Receiver) domain n=1 Tax=Flavobacterium defluvii TaxID=370979 RepID=A0A1M5IHQ6_9FLAO|nr:response regulator [Flavobacterium defluvii]SHG27832.1 CheY chemotaxis protein or a CheY-like REC (receiver) domain [Flavobacterium defluvii]